MEVKSTLSKYPGYIVLPDYLTAEQAFAVEDCQWAARDYIQENTEGEDGSRKPGKRFSDLRLHYQYLPAILQIVKEWHLEGFSVNGNGATMESFPMTPATDISDLLLWTWNRIVEIYNGATQIPNE